MATEYYGTQGYNVRAALVTETSQTNTSVTISATAQLQRYQNYGAPYRIYLKIGSEVSKSSIGVNENTYSNWTTVHSCSGSYTYTRKETAYTVTISSNFIGERYGEWNPGPYSGSTSVKITIPALSTYTISYNANGGSGAPSGGTKYYGKDFTLSKTKPTRTGYTFQGWGTSSSDTTVDYAAEAIYKGNSNLSLYAIWKANTYIVKYDANGGTNPPQQQTKTYGVTLKLSTTAPTRASYKFLGWAESSSSTSAAYQPGSTFSNNKDTTLYAIWALDIGTIYYDTNGGSPTPNSQTGQFNSYITISSTIPKRDWYKFKGWYNGEFIYQPGAQYYISATSTTLVAQWEQIYFPPKILSFTGYRCDEYGNPLDDGKYASVQADVQISEEDENGNKINHTLSFSPSPYSQNNGVIIIPVASNETIITAFLEDSKGQTDTKTLTIRTSFFTAEVAHQGKSIGIGGAAPEENIPENGLVQVSMDADIKNKLILSPQNSTYETKTFYNIASYRNNQNNNTGAIIIEMEPSNYMIDMEVSIYQYNCNYKLLISGYTYQSGGAWVGPQVSMLGKGTNDTDLKVRFGSDSSQNKCIIIGDTTTTWNGYFHATINRVTIGYNNHIAEPNWTMNLTTNYSIYTIDHTLTVSTPGSSTLTLDDIYPVGSIYLAYDHTSPASRFGGTWARIENRFLWACSSGGTIGSVGGSQTASVPLKAHTHTIPALSGTAASAGSHSHYIPNVAYPSSGDNGNFYFESWQNGSTSRNHYTNSAGAHTHTVTTDTGKSTGSTGESSPSISTMPPYIQISAWRRTA